MVGVKPLSCTVLTKLVSKKLEYDKFESSREAISGEAGRLFACDLSQI